MRFPGLQWRQCHLISFQYSRYTLLFLCLTDLNVTSSSDIYKLTREPRNGAQWVASVRHRQVWRLLASCEQLWGFHWCDVSASVSQQNTRSILAHYEVSSSCLLVFLPHFSVDRSLFQPCIIRIWTHSSWGAWIMVSQYFQNCWSSFLFSVR